MGWTMHQMLVNGEDFPDDVTVHKGAGRRAEKRVYAPVETLPVETQPGYVVARVVNDAAISVDGVLYVRLGVGNALAPGA